MTKRLLSKKWFNCGWRDNTGWKLQRAKTEHRDIAKCIRSWDTKNAITNRHIAMAISRDEVRVTRSIDWEGTVRKEMGFLVCCRSLSTIIEVSTRAIIVMVTNSIDSILLEVAIVMEDMLEDQNIFKGTGGMAKQQH